MLTIFGIPKAFEGHFEVIQRNAIQSWINLSPRCQILLLGDEKGTAEAAAEFGVRHIPAVGRNEFGTPLLNSIFAQAEKESTHSTLCFINSDIILMSDFLPAIQRVLAERDRFLLVGQRRTLNVRELLRFEDGWEAKLRALAEVEGHLDNNTAIDYFVFRPGIWGDTPPFAIGRPFYDNWLVHQANHRKGVSVIDLTEVVTVVHQDHSRVHPDGVDGLRKGPEGQRNLALAGGYTRGHTIWDAKYKLTSRGLEKRHTPYFLYRRFVDLVDRHPSLQPVLKFVRFLIRHSFRLTDRTQHQAPEAR
ncbi:MAG: hypothetical protein WCD43_12410 [Candidatus Acidiferrales bacterium]